ncbi:MAG: Gfo/Idh/MocA family oxidoreductase, partial [Armatimonadetes bacterium]|nr:Gfo/Idh/MocA family oxidoreductase [Armatimonadota bacterium]
MKSIGVGIVGYGLAGKWFHKMLVDATSGLHLAAITSRSAEKREQAARENPDAVVVQTFEQLLNCDQVEVVVLATPHHVHCAETIAALEAGKHVVVDKIMARSVAEADAMVAAEDRTGRLLSVFHNRRWDSDYLTVRQALADGLLGEVYTVDIAVTRPGMPLKPLAGEKRWRATREAFGGQLVDWGAHLMDQAVLLGGPSPDRVFCDLQYRHDGNETDSEGFVALHYRNGLRLTVTAGVQSWIEKPHWFINGSAGSLVIDGIDPQEQIMRSTGEVPAGTPAAALPAEAVRYRGSRAEGLAPVPGNWVAYYENVRDALRGEAELAVTARQCRDVLRLYERC